MDSVFWFFEAYRDIVLSQKIPHCYPVWEKTLILVTFRVIPKSYMSSETPHPDQRYIDGLCRKDPQVIREIYQTFNGTAKKYVLANSGNLQDAEDLFNQTLIILIQNTCRREFTLTGAFGGYLMAILRRKWLDELKRRKRSGVTYGMPEGYEIEAADESSEATDEWARNDHKREIFLRCFEQLSDNCRKFLQTSWEVGDMKKAAELLETTYAYARKRKANCMAKLVALVRQDPEYSQLFNN